MNSFDAVLLNKDYVDHTFAIVYRYCIRENTNPMLEQGAVEAFVFVWTTIPKVQVPTYCTEASLECELLFLNILCHRQHLLRIVLHQNNMFPNGFISLLRC